jgi:hypothetical protein
MGRWNLPRLGGHLLEDGVEAVATAAVILEEIVIMDGVVVITIATMVTEIVTQMTGRSAEKMIVRLGSRMTAAEMIVIAREAEEIAGAVGEDVMTEVHAIMTEIVNARKRRRKGKRSNYIVGDVTNNFTARTRLKLRKKRLREPLRRSESVRKTMPKRDQPRRSIRSPKLQLSHDTPRSLCVFLVRLHDFTHCQGVYSFGVWVGGLPVHVCLFDFGVCLDSR